MVSMKKKKEPQPYFFTNIPKKELDKLLKGDEDKTMTKKTGQTSERKTRATKKSLTPEDIARMIAEWDDKTTSEWADEFGVSYQTVLKMAEVVRKDDKTLCPKKKPKPRTREDVAKAGIALFRKKQGKK
jgi:phage/plasmid primase-like uncharacterized protein